MARSQLIRFRWNGPAVLAEVHRRTEDGLKAIAEDVASNAKEIVHVVTGTLQRSIHVATPGAGHAGDENAAASGVDLQRMLGGQAKAKRSGGGATIEVGSWISYAAVEEALIGGSRGGNHAYLRPAVDRARSAAQAKFREGFGSL